DISQGMWHTPASSFGCNREFSCVLNSNAPQHFPHDFLAIQPPNYPTQWLNRNSGDQLTYISNA
ncbi:MAG: hypothetical protein AAF629_33015, partial [Chloroflexota bacterium]